MRLPTDFWIGALIRRVEQGGAFAAVLRRGDARAGSVLVKAVDRRAGVARLYAETVGGDGERIWMEPLASTDEADLDAYVERAARVDEDIWVLEIDDPKGRHFLTEKVAAR